jgi:hypothetical protein
MDEARFADQLGSRAEGDPCPTTKFGHYPVEDDGSGSSVGDEREVVPAGMPDPEFFVECMRDGFEEITKLV